MKRTTLGIALLFVLPVFLIFSYIRVERLPTHTDEEANRIEGQTRLTELEAASQTLSQAMHSYRIDKGEPPEYVDDLIEAGYLKAIPKDIIDAGYLKGMPRRREEYSDPPMPTAIGHSRSASIAAN